MSSKVVQSDRAQLVEFVVARSKRYVYNSSTSKELQERELAGRPICAEKYVFYNVLWIEWDDGVADRSALGRVVLMSSYRRIWKTSI
jgi:hypothetical protein